MNLVIPQLPHEFKKLAYRWSNSHQDEIDCCELACATQACIDDFKWRAAPVPTQEYKKWRFLNEDEKKEFIAKRYAFYVQNIKDFEDNVEIIKNQNVRNENQLRMWLKLPVSQGARRKIEEAFNSYSSRGTPLLMAILFF